MLLNSRELLAYDVAAGDEIVGRVRDLLVDDKTWKVRHIVADTGGFLSTHKVIVTPEFVKEVTHPEDTIKLAASKEDIESGKLASSNPPVSVHQNDPTEDAAIPDPHLRSAREIGGYDVEATDASLGDVHGLMIETDTWNVRYLVVDTGDLINAKQVLIIPSVVQKIDWEEKSIKVGLSVAMARDCPEYDAASELSRHYEGFLHDYYGWPRYWG